jgi:hypothetical protein
MSELVKQSRLDIELNADNLEQLAAWVSDIASPENLAWESDRFKDLRNLLRTRKAAADLRIQAVKIECIALRRIGLAGLESKLDYANRKIALHFAGMTDESFQALMDDCNTQSSPAAFLRSLDVEWEERQRYYRGGMDREPIDDLDFEHEALSVLETLAMGDSFTVAEAAGRLYDRLCERRLWHSDKDFELPREFADEPLREVVRAVMRGPQAGETVYSGDTELSIPHNVTYQTTAGYVRIPWTKAMLLNYRYMVSMRQEQARDLANKARAMSRLLEMLDGVLDSETMPVDAGLQELMRRGLITKTKG